MKACSIENEISAATGLSAKQQSAVRAVLKVAADNGVEIFVAAGKLKARAGKGGLPDDLKQMIADQKFELLIYFQQIQPCDNLGEMPPLVAVDRSVNLSPASFAQERLWLTQQLSVESHAYNIHGAFLVGPEFDVGLAERAFAAVIQRHESLRTTVFYSGTQVMQQVHVAPHFKIRELCLEAREAASVDSLLDEHSRLSFDLDQFIMLDVLFIAVEGAQSCLSICMPHIVSDGWSEGLLINEFVFFYNALQRQQRCELPPLLFQYRDYAYWQRQWMTSPACDRQLEYWRAQLSNAPAYHSLPINRRGAELTSNLAANISLTADIDLTNQLIKLANDNQVTLFMLLHGVLTILLSRHSNSDDIVIGTPVANRVTADLEPLIGFFVNTLVLRSHCNENQLLADFLAQIKQINLAAQDNQFIPFSYLVEKLKPSRSAGVSPFFQILLVMDNNEHATFDLGGETLSPVARIDDTAKYDLTLYANETSGGLEFTFNFKRSLFDQHYIEQLGTGFINLLRNCVADCNRPITALSTFDPIAPQREHSRRLAMLPTYDQRPLHELFAEYAEKFPHQLAVKDELHSFTYGELNAKANQLAHYLRDQGVAADTLVGLTSDWSAHTLLGLLGILKAGAAYLPLEADYPLERLKFILADSAVRCVLTLEKNVPLLQVHVECIALDGIASEALLGGYPKDKVPVGGDVQRHLAYVIYTSGSTGKPKGVMVEHRGLSHYVQGVAGKHEIPIGLNYAVLSTIATDLGNTVLFLSLTRGGTLHIPARQTAMDVYAFNRFIQARDIHVIKLTPSHFCVLASSDFDSLLSKLKYVFLGGEIIPLQLYQALQREQGRHGCQFINHYGPTEITIGCCTYPLDFKNNADVPIGKPFLHGLCSLRDRYGNPAPTGAPGELYISGPGVARGYLNQAELTHQRYISETPAACGEPVRTYRTGDWARENAEGDLVFLGRLDDQVKIRGFRIELGEIEQTILSHVAAESAVVKVLSTSDSNVGELIAYLKFPADTSVSFDEKAAVSAITEVLPAHMIPRYWLVMDVWPLTSNGKIDRRALPLPDTDISAEIIAPHTDTEIVLHKLWTRLLNLDPQSIGVRSDFFVLGGHSLLAIRLAAEVRENLKVEISIRDIFDNPCLLDLAALIASLSQQQSALPTIAVAKPADRYALSYGQQLIWFIDLMERGSKHYNMPAVMHVDGNFRIDIAQQSFQEIVNRHSILRSVYIMRGEQVYQEIKAQATFLLGDTDLSAIAGAEQRQRLSDIMQADVERIFNLAEDLPIRAHFVRLSASSGKLIFNMHHIASDGWSMRVLMREFSENYSHLAQSCSIPQRPPLALQYSDFAEWQRTWLKDERMEAQLIYWQTQLANLPELHSLPLDAPRPENRTFNGGGVSAVLEQTVVDQLRIIARQNSCSLFMVLHAAFSLLLCRHSNCNDIVIGTPVANRLHASLEPLIGFFVNTLVLRTQLNPTMTFVDLLQQVRETNLAAQSNQDVAFEQVVERINPQRSIKYSPLFQIMLTLDDEVSTPTTIDDLQFSPEFHQEFVSKFELTVDATALADGYFFNFQYNTDIFSKARIQNFATDFIRLLTSIARMPHSVLRNINHLSTDELSRIGVLRNSRPAAHDAQQVYFDQQFECRALEYPHRPALEFGGKIVTYSQLNVRVNQLSYYLKQKGVRHNDVVAVLLDRSIDLVVSILAIMRAGATYMTVDIHYPHERILDQLRSSKSRFCVTHTAQQAMIAQLDITLVVIDEDVTQKRVAECSPDSFTTERPSAASQIAYVMYTSGSTGRPKGVAVSHANLMAYAQAVLREYAIDASDKVLQFSSISFDIFIEEMTVSLLSGACLVIRDEHMLGGGEYFWSKISALGITVVSLPTAFWHQLSRELLPTYSDKINGLKLVILGGERLSAEAVTLWRQVASTNIRLVNTYGPTETTVAATIHTVSGDPAHYLNGSIPIGVALDHCELVVLAPDQSLAPIAAVGELYIGGPGVAQGYLYNEQQTNERFLNGVTCDSDRLYRTGDWVRWADCEHANRKELEFIGRADSQVKINGYRVEPGEVEYQISKLTEIDNAIVVVNKSELGRSRLIAYVTLANVELRVVDNYREKTKLDVLRQLRELLPDYMVPETIEVLDKFPLTTNGKVDVKHLPQPIHSLLNGITLPATDLEIQLAKLWGDLFETTIHDMCIKRNFFELGGHSILTIRMIVKIAQQFGVELTVRDVFLHPTIQLLAEKIQAGTTTAPTLMSTLHHAGITSTRLFCIPGALGSALSFMGLIEHNSNLTIFAFDHLGVFNSKSPHESIEQMAECMKKEIIQEQTEGPYFIVGHSMGAKVAYEIVRRLEASGESAYLIALDSQFPQCDAGQSPSAIRAGAQQDQISIDDDIQLIIEKIEQYLQLEGVGGKLRERLESVYLHHALLSQNYVFSAPLINDVLVLYAADNTLTRPASLTYLSQGQVLSSEVVGNHYSMLFPVNTRQLMEKISVFVGQRSNAPKEIERVVTLLPTN